MSRNPLQSEEHRAWLDRNRASWNERAARWDAMLDERADELGREAQRVAIALSLEPGMRLLDAGCGTGQWAVGFARQGVRVTAVDLASEMVARARLNAEEAGVEREIELREGDIAHINDADATYDAVHCRCALQFHPDPAAVLREIERVLKRGGRIFVSVPGALSPIYASSWQRFIEPGTVTTRMLPWELESLLDALGWQVVGGWGAYMMAGDQGRPVLTEEQAQSLPQPLQQAGCTFWATIATREN